MKKSILLFLTATAVAAAMTACSKPADPSGSSAAAQSESSANESAAAEAAQEETTADETKAEVHYGIIKGTITEGTEDDLEILVTTDEGQELSVGPLEITSVETVIEPGRNIAIVYAGDFDGSNLENLDLYLMLEQHDNMEIKTVTGVTTANAMSTFQLKTDDGQEIDFMKDNCGMEKDAMTKDSGDRVKVVYLASGEDTYPLYIYKAQ